MTWTQAYTPVGGSLALSTLVAAVPVVLLLGLLALGHAKAHVAAAVGLAASLLIAVFVYGMPAKLASLAAVYGAAYGLFPIGWIVLCAIFVYDVTVRTGQFEIVKRSIAGLAADARIQVLLIAFSFGAFIEGAAGFGTPVAISAAMLIGLGFRPLKAAGLALIGNTAPVAFGALGTPVETLARVTGLDLFDLSAMVGRQLPFFSLIVPFWLVAATAGWRRTLEVWPACAVTGVSFAAVQFAVSNYHGPWLVDIAAALVSIAALVGLLRVWQPHETWRFEGENEGDRLDANDGRRDPDRVTAADIAPDIGEAIDPAARAPIAAQPVTRREAWRAWMPWIVTSVFVFAWGVPQVKGALNGVSSIEVPIAGLHEKVFRAPPVVPTPKPEEAIFKFNWLSATGTGLLLAGVVSGLLLGLRPAEIAATFLGTLGRVRFSLLTIAAMLALGYSTRLAGIDSTLGLAFASTGPLFPFFSALLGWLGVALTGSDTSSNVLFGNLQKVTAEQLGVSPVLAAASNSSGGVMGKMIDAQSIVVAGVATGRHGEEGRILRYVFFHSIALAALVGLLVLAQARLLNGMVPPTRKPAQTTPASPEIDRLLTLMHDRLRTMHDVARSKHNSGRPVDDPERERALLDDMATRGRAKGLDESLVRTFFQAQIDASKQIQRTDLARWRNNGQGPFPDAPDLAALRTRIDAVNGELLESLAASLPALQRAESRRTLPDFATHILVGDGIDASVRQTAIAPLVKSPATPVRPE